MIGQEAGGHIFFQNPSRPTTPIQVVAYGWEMRTLHKLPTLSTVHREECCLQYQFFFHESLCDNIFKGTTCFEADIIKKRKPESRFLFRFSEYLELSSKSAFSTSGWIIYFFPSSS